MFQSVGEEERYEAEIPEWYKRNQKPSAYLWAQHFSLPESKRNPVYTQVFHQELSLVKVCFPFLDKTQLDGRTYQNFGIPNVCGEISKKFLQDYGKKPKRRCVKRLSAKKRTNVEHNRSGNFSKYSKWPEVKTRNFNFIKDGWRIEKYYDEIEEQNQFDLVYKPYKSKPRQTTPSRGTASSVKATFSKVHKKLLDQFLIFGKDIDENNAAAKCYVSSSDKSEKTVNSYDSPLDRHLIENVANMQTYKKSSLKAKNSVSIKKNVQFSNINTYHSTDITDDCDSIVNFDVYEEKQKNETPKKANNITKFVNRKLVFENEDIPNEDPVEQSTFIVHAQVHRSDVTSDVAQNKMVKISNKNVSNVNKKRLSVITENDESDGDNIESTSTETVSEDDGSDVMDTKDSNKPAEEVQSVEKKSFTKVSDFGLESSEDEDNSLLKRANIKESIPNQDRNESSESSDDDNSSKLSDTSVFIPVKVHEQIQPASTISNRKYGNEYIDLESFSDDIDDAQQITEKEQIDNKTVLLMETLFSQELSVHSNTLADTNRDLLKPNDPTDPQDKTNKSLINSDDELFQELSVHSDRSSTQEGTDKLKSNEPTDHMDKTNESLINSNKEGLDPLDAISCKDISITDICVEKTDFDSRVQSPNVEADALSDVGSVTKPSQSKIFDARGSESDNTSFMSDDIDEDFERQSTNIDEEIGKPQDELNVEKVCNIEHDEEIDTTCSVDGDEIMEINEIETQGDKAVYNYIDDQINTNIEFPFGDKVSEDNVLSVCNVENCATNEVDENNNSSSVSVSNSKENQEIGNPVNIARDDSTRKLGSQKLSGNVESLCQDSSLKDCANIISLEQPDVVHVVSDLDSKLKSKANNTPPNTETRLDDKPCETAIIEEVSSNSDEITLTGETNLSVSVCKLVGNTPPVPSHKSQQASEKVVNRSIPCVKNDISEMKTSRNVDKYSGSFNSMNDSVVSLRNRSNVENDPFVSKGGSDSAVVDNIGIKKCSEESDEVLQPSQSPTFVSNIKIKKSMKIHESDKVRPVPESSEVFRNFDTTCIEEISWNNNLNTETEKSRRHGDLQNNTPVDVSGPRTMNESLTIDPDVELSESTCSRTRSLSSGILSSQMQDEFADWSDENKKVGTSVESDLLDVLRQDKNVTKLSVLNNEDSIMINERFIDPKNRDRITYDPNNTLNEGIIDMSPNEDNSLAKESSSSRFDSSGLEDQLTRKRLMKHGDHKMTTGHVDQRVRSTETHISKKLKLDTKEGIVVRKEPKRSVEKCRDTESTITYGSKDSETRHDISMFDDDSIIDSDENKENNETHETVSKYFSKNVSSRGLEKHSNQKKYCIKALQGTTVMKMKQGDDKKTPKEKKKVSNVVKMYNLSPDVLSNESVGSRSPLSETEFRFRKQNINLPDSKSDTSDVIKEFKFSDLDKELSDEFQLSDDNFGSDDSNIIPDKNKFVLEKPSIHDSLAYDGSPTTALPQEKRIKAKTMSQRSVTNLNVTNTSLQSSKEPLLQLKEKDKCLKWLNENHFNKYNINKDLTTKPTVMLSDKKDSRYQKNINSGVSTEKLSSKKVQARTDLFQRYNLNDITSQNISPASSVSSLDSQCMKKKSGKQSSDLDMSPLSQGFDVITSSTLSEVTGSSCPESESDQDFETSPTNQWMIADMNSPEDVLVNYSMD